MVPDAVLSDTDALLAYAREQVRSSRTSTPGTARAVAEAAAADAAADAAAAEASALEKSGWEDARASLSADAPAQEAAAFGRELGAKLDETLDGLEDADFLAELSKPLL